MPPNAKPKTLQEQSFPENGRHYLETGGRKILTPCDEKARKEMDLLHNVLGMARRKRMFRAPIGEDIGQQGMRILDVGTGTGIWAIEMADTYRSSDVRALDLAMLQPASIPLNFRVHQADVEDDWAKIEGLNRGCFDLIHIRCMYGCIRNWERLYSEVLQHLRPRFGYVEHVEIDWAPRCNDGTMPPDWVLSAFHEDYAQAMDQDGRSVRVNSQQTQDRLARCGFVDIAEEVILLPINGWRDDDHDRMLGCWVGAIFLPLEGKDGGEGPHYQEGRTLAALTRIKNRSADEVRAQLRRVAQEIPRAALVSSPRATSTPASHLSIHAYLNL